MSEKDYEEEQDYEEEEQEEEEECESDDSAFTMSGHTPTKEDRVVYQSISGKVKWQIDTISHKFYWLNLPYFFEDAPENVKHDLIEWCREYAIVQMRKRGDRPMRPESVVEWMQRPEVVVRRKIRENKE